MSIGKNCSGFLTFSNTPIVFNTSMEKYCGSIDTIKNVYDDRDDDYSKYKLENQNFTWLDIWLDLEEPYGSRFVESFDEAVYLGD